MKFTPFVRRSAQVISLVTIAAITSFLAPAQALADTCNPVPQDETQWVCNGSITDCPQQSGGTYDAPYN